MASKTVLALARTLKGQYEQMPLRLSQPDGYLALRWLCVGGSLPAKWTGVEMARRIGVSQVVVNDLAGRITRALYRYEKDVPPAAVIAALEQVIAEIREERSS